VVQIAAAAPFTFPVTSPMPSDGQDAFAPHLLPPHIPTVFKMKILLQMMKTMICRLVLMQVLILPITSAKDLRPRQTRVVLFMLS